MPDATLHAGNLMLVVMQALAHFWKQNDNTAELQPLGARAEVNASCTPTAVQGQGQDLLAGSACQQLVISRK